MTDEVRNALTPPGYLVSFRVFGKPTPQSGSRAVSTPAGTRLITTGGVGLKYWRREIAVESSVRRLETGTLDGPLGLDVEFRFAMPKSRSKATRAQGRVPHWVRPDLDKLLRAVLDGIREGGLIRDDAQVCSLVAYKCEIADDWVGAEIRLREYREEVRQDDTGRSARERL